MGVRNDPLLHLNGKPEAVNTKGYNGKKEPLNVVAEQLHACAVKVKLLSVNDGVIGEPTLIHTYCPGKSKSESTAGDQAAKYADTDHFNDSAGKLRFHNVKPPIAFCGTTCIIAIFAFNVKCVLVISYVRTEKTIGIYKKCSKNAKIKRI